MSASGRTGTTTVDLRALERALRAAVDGEIRFDAGDRHLYATDASHYRRVPLGVVLPRTVEALATTVQVCAGHGVSITHRGGGTSLAGQTTGPGIIIDSSKYLRAFEVDPGSRSAHVQPGVVLDDLQRAAAPHGLTFGPDPSTQNRCTLGGMIGNDSCGIHSVRWGRTQDNVSALDIVLTDGARMRAGAGASGTALHGGERASGLEAQLRDLVGRWGGRIRDSYPQIPRRVSGYNLDQLLPEHGFDIARSLVGTEGTCVTVLGAEVDLVEDPAHRSLLVVGFADIFEAADAVPIVLEHEPLGLEGMDARIAEIARMKRVPPAGLDLLPGGGGWLLVELDGDGAEDAVARAETLATELGAVDKVVLDDPVEAELVWAVRKSGLGASAIVPDAPPKWTGWEDAAVHPSDLGAYLRDFRSLLDEHRLDTSLYGHFGDGCVHCRISFDFADDEGVARYRDFVEDAADLVVSYGGSLSGEHGDGQSRAELLERMYGPELVRAFREFRALWDPDGLMNPGTVVDPRPLDADLRLLGGPPGGGPDGPRPETVFAYPDDGGDLRAAVTRCVGIGTCRRDDGAGTMCPSYMVTREEAHSTRGRAHLLFEMLKGDSELHGWRDERVRGALDLCLSCKGCKTDCPVGVDIATYKAEFLHHHWRGRARPAAHYALGLVPWLSRAAALAPGLANAILGGRFGSGLRGAVGLTPHRRPPAYARRSFRARFSGGTSASDRGAKVVLFPDTFTDRFAPQVGTAAVEVLEDAGYRVQLPPRWVCCGRPLYDHGMLHLARRQLRELMEVLGPLARDGTAIVGLEPSCIATFRDELVAMFPDDPGARQLAEATYTLAEFLIASGYEPPALERRAIVHGHCHQKATVGMHDDGRLLDRMGLTWRELDAGCCGLAGGFGYESGDRYEVSVAAGERKLGPAVRGVDDDTLIIADGFSCRSQIEHLQDRRRALHLAQVIQLALRYGPGGPQPGGGPVEDVAAPDEPASVDVARSLLAAGLAGGLVVGAGVLARRRRPQMSR